MSVETPSSTVAAPETDLHRRNWGAAAPSAPGAGGEDREPPAQAREPARPPSGLVDEQVRAPVEVGGRSGSGAGPRGR